MRRFLLLCIVLAFPSLAQAANPVCGLHGDQAAILPSQFFGTLSISGSAGTWISGSQFQSSWTSTFEIYTQTGTNTALTISGTPTSTSISFTTSPGNGTYDYTFNNNYTTFTPPSSVGGSYVDVMTGCTVTRITNDGLSAIYYASLSPLSVDNSWLLVWEPANGGYRIVCWRNANCAAGSLVVPDTSFPGSANGTVDWDRSTATKFYYQGSTNQLMSGTITGLPGCLATHNCTITSATVHTFSEYAGGVGTVDEPDITPDGSTLQLVGFNSSGTGTMDVFTWNLNTSTKTVWHTTSCTGSHGSNQPGCLHKIQLTNMGEPIITYNNMCSGNSPAESGTVWYHGAGPTASFIQCGNSTHLDAGLDKSGNEVMVQDRNIASGGTDPCPAGQWSGAQGGGGADVTLLTAPTGGTCWIGKNYAGPHVSYRGNASSPWALMSMADANGGRTGCPEAAGCSVTATQVNTTTSGTNWYPYEEEHLLAQIDNNNSLTGLYRMAVGRSRSNANFWAQNTGSLSPDHNYIVFNSNMAFPSVNCSNSGTAGCSDVYIISGVGGAPLFGTVAAPTSPVIIASLGLLALAATLITVAVAL